MTGAHATMLVSEYGGATMTMNELTAFFGWASVINIAILALMTLGVTALKGLGVSVHGKMFNLSAEELMRQYFQYLGQYKIATFIFAIVPYLALRIMQS